MVREGADAWTNVVIDAVPNALLMIDEERTIVLLNRSAEALFGYERQEMLGKAFETLLDGGLGRRKDGSSIPVEIALSPIETAAGAFTLASIVDLTERRRAEATHERLAAIVESSEDAIISKTLDGIITSWNRGAERLFDFTAAETIGFPIGVIVPDDRAAEEDELRARVRRKERVSHFETRRRKKDGTEIDASVTLSPILGPGGQVVGVSTIARDITGQKQRDAELQRSNAELEQFAYVASHDLQEPLRMVANYTELLEQRYKGKLDEKADKYIHYASDGARRMQRLVADLLAYSRVGSQGKDPVPVATEAVVKSVIASLHGLVRESGATIAVGPLPPVLADEVQLRQLVQNLVSNAIKFRAESAPAIAIEAVPSGGRVLFSIRDNGIGLEAQYADRIFEMFQRLHERGKYDGSGMGLAIAKRIVERHGGQIRVESELGHGATFFFTLAAVTAAAATPRSPS
jgi:PAS domain S-box-containing protein